MICNPTVAKSVKENIKTAMSNVNQYTWLELLNYQSFNKVALANCGLLVNND